MMCKGASGDYRKILVSVSKRTFVTHTCSLASQLHYFCLVIGGIMAPKDVHILTPGPYERVAFHGKRDFVDVVKKLELGPFI